MARAAGVLAAVMLGLGAWVATNGIFSELPLLVNDVPEGWAIASQLSLAAQIANIGPFAFVLLRRRYPSSTFLHGSITAVLVIAMLALTLLAFTWKTTARIGGHQSSVMLLLLTGIAACCDSVTTVTFLPFMADVHLTLLRCLFLGESLSGVLPIALTWIQSDGITTSDKTLFSVCVFFLLLAFQMVLATLAFFFLVQRKHCFQRISEQDSAKVPMLPKDLLSADHDISHDNAAVQLVHKKQQSSTHRYWWHLCVLGILSFFQNGALQSTLSYASLPLGNNIYHASQSILMGGAALGALAAVWSSSSHVVLHLFLLMFSSACSICIVCLGLRSVRDEAFAAHGDAMTAVVIGLTGLASFVMGWQKTVVAGLVHTDQTVDDEKAQQRTMLCLGGSIQTGSFLGALLFFVLVNHSELYQAS